MKELPIEEKAQRYDEAIERAKKVLLDCTPEEQKVVEYISPELKESEDEKIRKDLLEHCKNQAKPYILTGNDCPQIQSWIAWLEKKGEQKPADKVEPKFKVGDWITNGKCTWKIDSIDEEMYYTNDCGIDYGSDIESIDKGYHLWAIQDAKSGDVLVCKKDTKYYERICLFNSLESAFFILTRDYNYVETYDIVVHVDYPNNTVPATKEQKEILCMAMKHVGYTFDFEKKELKKIKKLNV